MTIKTLTYPTPGPVALSVKTISAAVQVRIDDVERAVVTISTTAISGPSHWVVQDATLETMDGQVLRAILREGSVPTALGNITQPIIVHAVLPIGSSVDVKTTSGSIAVHGSADSAIVKSISGEINMEQARSASVQTVSGAITIEKVNSCGAGSTSGRIRIDDATGKVRAKTISGAITIGHSGWEIPEAKSISGRVVVSRLAVKDRR